MNLLRRLLGRPINLGKRVVLLGMDGLDPHLLEKWMDQGELPHFKQLADRGHFSPLQTTWMPLSPVAWSSFISGCNPGRHGIFDFLHRAPDSYEPQLSIARQEGPARTFEMGPISIPLSSGFTNAGRKGPAFWTESSREGVRTSVIRCPCSFPPEPVRGQMLSGLGVPDLNGTQGEFTFLTTNSKVDRTSRAGDIRVIDHPADSRISLTLKGPPNPFLKKADKTEVPLELEINGEILQITFQDQSVELKQKEWSGWQPIDFNFVGPVGVEGQVRFYLESLSPEFELYCSPINLSPDDPAFPISYPEGYAGDLSEEIGRYHTLGLTADTGMLKEKRVDEVAFLQQVQTVLDEREAMLKKELSDFKDGLFTFVFDIPDRVQHMFWRYRDSDHPQYTEQGNRMFGDVIKNNYRRMDDVLGWVTDQLDERDELVICSDHGFTGFRWQVDLNRWLVKEGYMKLEEGVRPREVGRLFQGVDWEQTRAYAMGLAGIFLNKEDREQQGIVSENEISSLLSELTNRLLTLKDSERGGTVVSEIKRASEIYQGDQREKSPDLLIGYHDGYRVSWESVLGGMHPQVIRNNMNPWSGDHCMDPNLIPGSLLTTLPVQEKKEISIRDIVPGVFSYLGIKGREKMDGSDHWIQS